MKASLLKKQSDHEILKEEHSTPPTLLLQNSVNFV